jgi:hypothetical protein
MNEIRDSFTCVLKGMPWTLHENTEQLSLALLAAIVDLAADHCSAPPLSAARDQRARCANITFARYDDAFLLKAEADRIDKELNEWTWGERR